LLGIDLLYLLGMARYCLFSFCAFSISPISSEEGRPVPTVGSTTRMFSFSEESRNATIRLLQYYCTCTLASFPGPAQLLIGKAGRAWYLLSYEHDVISNGKKIQNEKAMSCLTNHKFNAWCVQQSSPASYMCKLPGTFALLSPSVPTVN